MSKQLVIQKSSQALVQYLNNGTFIIDANFEGKKGFKNKALQPAGVNFNFQIAFNGFLSWPLKLLGACARCLPSFGCFKIAFNSFLKLPVYNFETKNAFIIKLKNQQ